jgi:hypothetical protein
MASGFFLWLCIVSTACSPASYQNLTDGLTPSDSNVGPKEKEILVVRDTDSIGLNLMAEDLSDGASVLLAPIIGVIIPGFASPRTMEATGGILEGIRVALDIFEEENEKFGEAELIVVSEGDELKGALEAAQELSRMELVGIVAFLQDDIMLEISRQVELSVPVISPVSTVIPLGDKNVISLFGTDPGASEKLAQQAFSSGLLTAAIVYSQESESTFEAEVFTDAFQELGGFVLGRFEYSVGSTFFEEHLRAVEAIMPDILFLPVPADDIELIAPQVTFFGLDSLGIRIFGTAGWSQDEVLNVVDTRHTDGVVTASPFPLGEILPGYQEFLSVYERIHQRTLPNLFPTFGYDAASILLEGIKTGAQTSKGFVEALEELSDFSGATGLLSVEDGHVVRKHFVTCLQDRTRRVISPYQQSQPIMMPPLPDPETDSIPEGAPDRIMGFQCSNSGS